MPCPTASRRNRSLERACACVRACATRLSAGRQVAARLIALAAGAVAGSTVRACAAPTAPSWRWRERRRQGRRAPPWPTTAVRQAQAHRFVGRCQFFYSLGVSSIGRRPSPATGEGARIFAGRHVRNVTGTVTLSPKISATGCRAHGGALALESTQEGRRPEAGRAPLSHISLQTRRDADP